MKRMHVNLAVNDLDASIAFYNSLFDSEPDVVKTDYAKWMLDDPRVNFDSELDEVYARLQNAGAPVIEEGATTCCYAESEKSWIFDPDSIAWETFLTHGESPVYGSDAIVNKQDAATCCTPAHATAKPGSNCC